MWFSRITFGCDGSGRCEPAPYHELNVMAPERDGGWFVPAIYATSKRSALIAWRYGMPKHVVSMSFREHDTWLSSRPGGSHVLARRMGTGRTLGALAALLAPLRTTPIRFPSGRSLRPTVLDTPRLQPALVVDGRLELSFVSARLLPLGLYAPGLVMRLPPP